MRERIAWKALALITGEAVTQLTDGRLPAEAPVFVSPYIRGREECPACRRHFLPLIYAPGQRTRAHHFHPAWRQGGIYHTHYAPYADNGWLAEGRCSATCLPGGREKNFHISTSFLTLAISALCIFCHYEMQRGRIASPPLSQRGQFSRFLYPYCSACQWWVEREGWREWGEFVIVEGYPLFTQTRKEVIAR